MNGTRWPIPLALTALAVGGAGIWHYARAQPEPAFPAAGGQGGEAGRRFTGFAAGGPGGAQLAVSGDNVFVLRGNTLYRLDAASLAVRAQADLPAPARTAEGRGEGRGEGGPAAAPEPPAGASSGADAVLVASGRRVFAASGCMNCHSIAGQGRGRAPDLTHIGDEAQHTPQWIAAYVKSPTSVDPDSRMPPFGDRISATDLDALGTYLASFK